MTTSGRPLAIYASGMVTGVGYRAADSCAAMRSAVDRFAETRYMDMHGQWVMGSQVVLEKPWKGLSKLVKMIAPAIRECLDQTRLDASEVPLLLCVAEKNRPGRIEGLDDALFENIQQELGLRFHPLSDVISEGRISGAEAMAKARQMVYDNRIPFCLIAGVDSLLNTTTMAAFEERSRLMTSENSNGFIPGEAGATILVGSPDHAARMQRRDLPVLHCVGIGEGNEKATIESEEPLRADGLVQAYRAGLDAAGCDLAEFDFRLSDANGEQYWFKEAALAIIRILRTRKEHVELWHPADCVGEIGAAIVPCTLGVALAAAQKGYAPGPNAIAHFGSDTGKRIAMFLKAEQAG